MGTLTSAYLPDGQLAILPVIPRTWVDTGPTTIGDSARAPLLQLDVSANVMWQRQRPLFQGFQSVAQSIPSGTWTAITGLNELSDNWSGHSDASNTGRYYAPDTRNGSPGDWYLCIGYVPYAVTSTSTVHFAGLRVTGSANVIEGGKISGGTGHNVDSMIVDLVQLNGFANDYVELMARQTSGSAANTVVSGKSSSLRLVMLSRATKACRPGLFQLSIKPASVAPPVSVLVVLSMRRPYQVRLACRCKGPTTGKAKPPVACCCGR